MFTYLTQLFSVYSWSCKSNTDIDVCIDFLSLNGKNESDFSKQPKLYVEPVQIKLHYAKKENYRFDTIKYIRFIYDIYE